MLHMYHDWWRFAGAVWVIMLLWGSHETGCNLELTAIPRKISRAGWMGEKGLDPSAELGVVSGDLCDIHFNVSLCNSSPVRKITAWTVVKLYKYLFAQSLYLSYLSIYLSIYISMSISLSLYLYISLSIYLYIYYISISISIYLYLSIYLPIYLSIYLSIYLPIYLSIYTCLHIYIYVRLCFQETCKYIACMWIALATLMAPKIEFLVTFPQLECHTWIAPSGRSAWRFPRSRKMSGRCEGRCRNGEDAGLAWLSPAG